MSFRRKNVDVPIIYCEETRKVISVSRKQLNPRRFNSRWILAHIHGRVSRAHFIRMTEPTRRWNNLQLDCANAARHFICNWSRIINCRDDGFLSEGEKLQLKCFSNIRFVIANLWDGFDGLMTEEEERTRFFNSLNECQDTKEIHTLPWRFRAADLFLIKNKVFVPLTFQ